MYATESIISEALMPQLELISLILNSYIDYFAQGFSKEPQHKEKEKELIAGLHCRHFGVNKKKICSHSLPKNGR